MSTTTVQVPNVEVSAQEAEWFSQRFGELHGNVDRFIRGKSGVIRLALVAMLAEGHVLIDDVPGVGKTSLAKALAQSISGSMSRIQFTPDLLPTDVTGVQIYNTAEGTFSFHAGPVFANVVVADEINRATPKTQSALLEVMEERQITVDGQTYLAPRPFIVMATQNPVELDGTYHLPEAQIDRFMMRMSMGYPDHASEVEVLMERTAGQTVESVTPVLDIKTVEQMITIARRVHVAQSLHEYAVSLTSATRNLEELRLGVSPRGSLALVQAAQSYAASQSRAFVTADDIKALAPYVLSHRMLLTADAEIQGKTAHGIIADILGAVRVPQDPIVLD